MNENNRIDALRELMELNKVIFSKEHGKDKERGHDHKANAGGDLEHNNKGRSNCSKCTHKGIGCAECKGKSSDHGHSDHHGKSHKHGHKKIKFELMNTIIENPNITKAELSEKLSAELVVVEKYIEKLTKHDMVSQNENSELIPTKKSIERHSKFNSDLTNISDTIFKDFSDSELLDLIHKFKRIEKNISSSDFEKIRGNIYQEKCKYCTKHSR